MDSEAAVPRLTQYLDRLLLASGLSLEYTLELQPADTPAPATPEPGAAPGTAVAITFTGADVPLLVARNAELLHAIESIAAAVLRLEPSEHHLLRFDAGDFRAGRARWLESSAEQAITRVRRTNQPFVFPSMNSRERRLLHLAIVPSGLRSASVGEGPRRSVVLYPAGQDPAAVSVAPRNPRSTRPPFNTPARRPSPPATRLPEVDEGNRSDDGSPSAASEAERIRAIRERFRSR